MARRKKALPQEPVSALVESLDWEGRGVAHVGGKLTFIDGALAGEEVRFRYRRLRSRFDEGTVVHVLRHSEDRVEPRCRHFGVCGGCSLQHMHPRAQLRAKQARLLETLRDMGGLEPARLLPPVTGPLWGYRRKARLGVKHVVAKGRVLVGFREKGNSFLADLTRCEVLHPSVGGRLEAIRDVVESLHTFDQIPQVEVAVAEEGTALVFRHLSPLPEADRESLRAFGRAQGLRVYLQAGGPQTVSLLHPDAAPGLSYRLPEWDVEVAFEPTDFTQVNAEINRRMIAQALDLMVPERDDRVLDLFCGLGNFTLPLSRFAGYVVGVEGDKGLVARARENARRNGIENAEFHASDLMHPDPAAFWRAAPYDKLLLDPPRSGAAGVIRGLHAPYPATVLYISCNPSTLARDAVELVQAHGYRLDSAGIIDMFPHTTHVESIALFKRQDRTRLRSPSRIGDQLPGYATTLA